MTAPKMTIDLIKEGISSDTTTDYMFELLAYQFMDVSVGFGALGKNWKIQATSRNDIAIMLMTLPAFPRLNRDGGKGSPYIRFRRMPAHFFRQW